MNKRKLKQLMEKRANAYKQMTDLLDSADDAGSLSAEDDQSYTRMETDLEQLTRSIERGEKLLGLTPEFENTLEGDIDLEDPAEQRDGRPVAPRATVQYRNAFEAFVRSGGAEHLTSEQRAALTVGVDGTAGFLAPTTFDTSIIKTARPEAIMRSIASVKKTATGNDIQIPRQLNAVTAAWTAELAAFNLSNPSIELITLLAHKNTVEVLVSHEALQDYAINIEQELADSFILARDELEDAAFVNGDGTNKPRGVLLDSTLGVTAASATAVTFDELVELTFSLDEKYEKNASFLINRLALKGLRKVKDTTGRYLWEPSVQVGAPSSLLGYPVRTNSSVPAPAVNAKSVAFGDYRYYVIRDAGGVSFLPLREKYADSGQAAFAAYSRVDGRLTLPEAVKHIKQAAI